MWRLFLSLLIMFPLIFDRKGRRGFSTAILSENSHHLLVEKHTSIDDLPDNDMTIEGWYFLDLTNNDYLYNKAANRWSAVVNTAGAVSVIFGTSGLHIKVYAGAVTQFGWNHIAITWDASEYESNVFVNGIGQGAQTGGSGSYTESAHDLYIGNVDGDNAAHVNRLSWQRISSVIRYTENFTPRSMTNPPVADVNTVRLFHVDEGSGTVVIDYSTNQQNALLSGDWR